MQTIQQSIASPNGVTVFGSYTLRVSPDAALVHLAVNRVASEPSEAFLDVREAVHAVREFLDAEKMPVEDVQTSHATMETLYRHTQEDRELIGYKAIAEFHVAIDDLGRVEAIIAGMVEAGADEVKSVQYHTRRMRELRTYARREAVAAARKKAEVYCEAARATLGDVVHIEDVNPDILTGREMMLRHAGADPDLFDPNLDELPQAYDPASIRISAGVLVAFTLTA